MKGKKGRKRWLQEHLTDNYVQQAKQQGYRSRAAFKLLEIQQKDKILRRGETVVDLGASPGGWSQVAQSLIGKNGCVIAVDKLAMDPINGVTFIQGDFCEQAIVTDLYRILGENPKVNLVLSDMAPNISGISSVDQLQAYQLAESALMFAQDVLIPQGNFLVKTFQGTGFEAFMKQLRQGFKSVVTRKPAASRGRSNEIYLLAQGKL